MFEFIAEIQEKDENMKIVLDALHELKRLDVLVGVPEDKTDRPEKSSNTITNAELMYIHTNGSPVNNTPPRPSIEPAIADDKETIGTLLGEAAKKALDGDKEGMRQSLSKAGMRGANVSKGWFTNPKNGWAPNSSVTIEGTKANAIGTKFIKGKRKKESDTIFTPLIDTGELRKSITYVIRER